MDEQEQKVAFILFHQGWTDILNSFALLNYNAPKYAHMFAIVRDDAKPLFDFYIRSMKNISVIYAPHPINILPEFFVEHVKQFNEIPESQIDRCYYGQWDWFRTDSFQGKWLENYSLTEENFVKNFYEFYDIPYRFRTDLFSFERDYEQEGKLFETFVVTELGGESGRPYTLYHNYQNLITSEIEDLQTRSPNVQFVNLHEKTPVFFDYIQILLGAKELHLVDSVWAALVYLLDARYNMFGNRNIPVTVYCKREYKNMFTMPYELQNWKIL